MSRIHDTPRTDAVLNTFDGKASKLAADLATHAENLERECDALTLEIVAAKCTLAKWIEWARMHGHLDHASGIAADTREILSENDQGLGRRFPDSDPT